MYDGPPRPSVPKHRPNHYIPNAEGSPQIQLLGT